MGVRVVFSSAARSAAAARFGAAMPRLSAAALLAVKKLKDHLFMSPFPCF
jgi:hypothetical protein